MKKIKLLLLLFISIKCAGQTTGYFRYDTVRIMKQNGTCELYLINKTKDSLGLLTNIGGGLTQFKKPRSLTDSTIVIGNDTLKILGRPGIGSGGGLSYIYSATAPTASDTSKIWIKTPDIAGVYNVYQYTTGAIGAWQRYGWLSIDGIFSHNRPVTIAMCGQSNAAGIGPGGDTSWLPGIIAFGSPSGNGTSTDFQYQWQQARINKSPFYSSNNNIAFQVAKQLKRNGIADIVRIITTYEGGTSLDSWINGGNGHALLDTFRVRLNRSGIDTIHAFLWHQGESGGVTGFTLGGYYVDQKVFYDTLCSPLTTGFFRNHTKYIAGGLGDATDSTMQYNAGSPEGAQRRLNEDGNLNTAWVPSWGLSDIGDGIHISGTGIDTFGYRYFTQVLRLPHTPYEEQPKLMYDTLYDKYVVHENLLTDYNGGSPAFRLLGTGIAWKNSTYNRIFTLAPSPGSVHVGEMVGFTNTVHKMFTVNGNATISDASYSLVIGGNWNGTGSPEHNVILANYPSNFTYSGGVSESVYVGYNAAYNTNAMPFNSVIIGSDAGLNVSPTAPGHFMTLIGRQAGTSHVGGYSTFIGGRAGQNAQGSLLTAIGMDAGASATTAWTNSTAIGANAKYTGNHQFVAGNNLTDFVMGGTVQHTFDVSGTPTTGQAFVHDGTKFVLTSSLGQNYANADLTHTGPRSHDADFNPFTVDNLGQYNLFARGTVSSLVRRVSISMEPVGANQLSLIAATRNADNSADSNRVYIRSADVSKQLILESTTTGTAKASVSIQTDSLQISAQPVATSDSLASFGPFNASTKTNPVYKISVTSNSLPHTLDALFTTEGNTGTGETDLYSYTLPAGKLAIDGRTVNFTIDGEVNDATATAQLKLYFAGNVTLNTGAVNISTAPTAWKLTGYIIRTSSTTAHVSYWLECPGFATDKFLGYSNLTSLDFTTTNIIKVTAQAGGAGGGNSDITAHSWQLLYKPQP